MLPLVAVGPALPAAQAADQVQFAPDRATTQAALRMLNDAATVDRDGRHNLLLRGLRQLEDPDLAPLFEGLVRPDSHPALKVHGLLGLAEIARPRGLTLQRVVEVERADVRGELISAALDSDLIDEPTRRQLLSWDGLTTGVKLLLAMPLAAEQRIEVDSPAHAALLTALGDPALGQRALAALLLHQLGDEQGTQGLIALNQDPSPSRDPVRATLLEIATRHNLDRARTWAYSIARESDLPERLEMLALTTAIRFGDERAVTWWSRQVNEATDTSRLARLALAGLDAAPWMPPQRFDPLVNHGEPFVAQVAATAKTVALAHANEAGPPVEQAVAGIVQTGHPQACRWAEDYTRRLASDTVAAEIARAVVLGYESGDTRGRARRLDAVVWATQVLLDRQPEASVAVLAQALPRDDAETEWRRAVLLGLIRSRSAAVARVCEAMPSFSDRESADLALNLRLRRPEPLSGPEEQALSLQVQGGTNLDDSLRVQAAWAYLKRTGQAGQAIAAVLAP